MKQHMHVYSMYVSPFMGGGVLFCPVHQVGNTSRSVPAQQLLNSLIKKLHILVLVWSRQVDDP